METNERKYADKCPYCGQPGELSYYACDVEPYPFDGVLYECWNFDECAKSPTWEARHDGTLRIVAEG